MIRICLLTALMALCFAGQSQSKYEFRGVWIASVDNIDWPKRNQYESESQKAEYIRQLEMHRQNGMNAVVVQVRPATDALYPSPYEPWSQWLTGTQGKPPSPYYDPLEFTINEAHKRGMEYHAWCNPYRANFSIGKASIAPNHITRLHPEWFLQYGTTLYFDPGNPEGQAWVVNVMRDMISRYDIDALHMDDYFYPYRIAGKEFPDSVSYAKYGNGMNREDWRRSNVDSIISKLSVAVKEIKPWVKFGISPFGVWRNKDKDPEGSATQAGQTNYDDLYADILLWLRNGWIDYVAPQIYWEFSQPRAPFQPILDWWDQHSYGRQCYIGLGIYRAGNNAAWKNPNELPRQIRASREKENVQGAIYFSSTSFEKNPNGWNDSLQRNYYRYPALIPPMNWIDSTVPAAPANVQVKFVDGDYVSPMADLHGAVPENGNIRYMAVYMSANKEDVIAKKPSALRMVTGDKQADNHMHQIIRPEMLFPDLQQYYIGVTYISRTNVESAISNLIFIDKKNLRVK